MHAIDEIHMKKQTTKSKGTTKLEIFGWGKHTSAPGSIFPRAVCMIAIERGIRIATACKAGSNLANRSEEMLYRIVSK